MSEELFFCEQTLHGHSDAVVALTHDDTRLYSSSQDATIRVPTYFAQIRFNVIIYSQLIFYSFYTNYLGVGYVLLSI